MPDRSADSIVSALSSTRTRHHSTARLSAEKTAATTKLTEGERQHRDLGDHHGVIGMAQEAIGAALISGASGTTMMRVVQ